MLFLNKTTSAIQTAVVKVIRKEVLKKNANIRVITTDGFSNNLAMFRELGCDPDPGQNEFIATGLYQPGSLNVRCMLDPFHSLKLLRSYWGDKKNCQISSR